MSKKRAVESVYRERERSGLDCGLGFWLDIALGIVGAIVGGFLFSAVLGVEGITGFNIWSLIVAIAGSVVVLWGYHTFVESRR